MAAHVWQQGSFALTIWLGPDPSYSQSTLLDQHETLWLLLPVFLNQEDL